jgi:hypothetical protein
MPEEVNPAPKPEPPSSLTETLVRQVVGFGVWVALGMAPFLGTVRVPGFTNLLDLYPVSLRGWLIPLSGLLMGVVAVVIEFLATYRLTQREIGRWFRRTLILWIASFLLLILLYPILVTRFRYVLPLEGKEETEEVTLALITGTPTVPMLKSPDCKCEPGWDAERCIGNISANEVNIRQCFGSMRVQLSNQALVLLYLLVTASFAASVGLLLLQQRRKAAAQRGKGGLSSLKTP